MPARQWLHWLDGAFVFVANIPVADALTKLREGPLTRTPLRRAPSIGIVDPSRS